MRRMKCLLAALSLTVVLSSCGGANPVRYDICVLARDGEVADGKLVETRAIGLFGAHGVSLTGRDCPGRFVEWHETNAFRASAGAVELGDAISQVRRDPMHPHSIELTVVGRLIWRMEGTRPHAQINVSQVSEIHLVEELSYPGR